jgi:NAD(P)-dependent dehydrogenase (short-subunit alcohol dehydrogenase family)
MAHSDQYLQESQHRQQPGSEQTMYPPPRSAALSYQPAEKLIEKVAVITGGDSGIGKATAIAFAKEGADCVISYLNEHEDAVEVKSLIEAEGRQCLLISGDVGSETHCQQIIQKTLATFSHIDILVNNAAEQHPKPDITEISEAQLERTFRTNIFAYFFLTKAAVPHLQPGATIINTTSVTAYKGSPELLDYSASKGAIVAFTRSLSQSLVNREIRVNGVAPGPVWTPLITSTFDKKKVESFGEDRPMGRPAQPDEIAPCFVFLASQDSSYMTGQILHPNGGDIING